MLRKTPLTARPSASAWPTTTGREQLADPGERATQPGLAPPLGGSVSASPSATAAKSARPVAASTEIPGQVVTSSTALPSDGARMGASPSRASARRRSEPRRCPMEVTHDRAEATTAAPAARPWTSRSPTRATTPGASSRARTNRVDAEPDEQRAVPSASLSEPKRSWPTATPRRHVVRESWIEEALRPEVVPSAGKAGRYMSNDSGANAASAPRYQDEADGAGAAACNGRQGARRAPLRGCVGAPRRSPDPSTGRYGYASSTSAPCEHAFVINVECYRRGRGRSGARCSSARSPSRRTATAPAGRRGRSRRGGRVAVLGQASPQRPVVQRAEELDLAAGRIDERRGGRHVLTGLPALDHDDGLLELHRVEPARIAFQALTAASRSRTRKQMWASGPAGVSRALPCARREGRCPTRSRCRRSGPHG